MHPQRGAHPCQLRSSFLAPGEPHLEDRLPWERLTLPFMPCLESSDNDSEFNDGMDTLELYSSLEVFKLFSQEPLLT